MTSAWQRVFQEIRDDHRSGASTLLADALEAGRLFLGATRRVPPRRLTADLARFTRRLTASQPSMAPFLTLANALWLCVDEAPAGLTWSRLHEALARYADAVDRGLLATIRNGARLVKSGSVVLTYSHSAAVRLALRCAMAAGRRFEVVCSESRPMGEGVALARHLAHVGITTYLTTDAALAGWMDRVDLVLVGADAVLSGGIVNKVGTEPLVRAARRAKVPSYVLADATKWLSKGLAGFWCSREEASEEIIRIRHRNLRVENRYFDCSSPGLFTGLVWEEGIVQPTDLRRRLAAIETSQSLILFLRGRGATGLDARLAARRPRRVSGASSVRSGRPAQLSEQRAGGLRERGVIRR
jgi:translation initiation factor eIF-2B subunit delta